MDFIPRPDNTKKFGVNWLKWKMYKYPHIFVIMTPLPFLFYEFYKFSVLYERKIRTGQLVPYVITNRYAICRSDDSMAQNSHKAYQN